MATRGGVGAMGMMGGGWWNGARKWEEWNLG